MTAQGIRRIATRDPPFSFSCFAKVKAALLSGFLGGGWGFDLYPFPGRSLFAGGAAPARMMTVDMGAHRASRR